MRCTSVYTPRRTIAARRFPHGHHRASLPAGASPHKPPHTDVAACVHAQGYACGPSPHGLPAHKSVHVNPRMGRLPARFAMQAYRVSAYTDALAQTF
ncbi:hypothetical protein K438DRAFT_1972924 [Mycena galopus ATCC 62051]|nr:hypothetical protein K438DRAFT_1972924 [Mycena galopus ATCC 62051]